MNRRTYRCIPLALLSLLAGILCSCGGGGGSTSGTTPPPPLEPPRASAPVLSSLQPPSAAAGSYSFTLTVNGSGFVNGAMILWNGSAKGTSFVNSSTLTAYISASDVAQQGTASVTATNPGSGASNALSFTIKPSTKISLPANRLIYDPGRQKIYASVPSRAGSPRADTVTVIDPATVTIVSSISVGSEPNVMAMSQDGKYLYVGLDGVGAVRRVDLATQTAGLQFTLGSDSFGKMYADDIAVMPGNSEVIAVSRRYNGVIPDHAGVAIYDNGVQRPNATPGHTGSNRIEFSGSPSTLYGYNNESSEFGFYRMKVDANGVSIIDSVKSLITGFGIDITYDSGLIYSTGGDILDPVTNTRVGKFTTPGSSSSVLPDSAAGRVYFLPYDFMKSSYSIVAYDKATFINVGSIAVPAAGTAGASNLVRWGSNGFALTASDQVIIINDPLTPNPASNLGVDELPVNHILYDANRQKIYASVPSRAGTQGNSIAIIDPATSKIESCLFVGSEPNAMAMSQDGRYLYVGLDGVGSIRKLDLMTQTAGLQFTLGLDSLYGSLFAEDIAVMPGNSDVIAVSRRYSGVSPRHAGVAIYDNGVRRPNTTPGHTGSNRIEFAESPSTLYGYNNETTDYGFRRMNVDANGVSVIDSTSNLISGFGADIAYDSGRIYSTNGAILDVNVPTLAGKLSASSMTAISPDVAAGRVYALAYDGAAKIIAYDTRTFVPVGSFQVSQVNTSGHDLLRCGSAGFAFVRDSDSRIVLANGAFTPPPAITSIDKLPANHLLYDAGRQKIYASVPSRAGERGNSVTIINPATSAIENSFFVGSEPNAMALSKDGKYLYIGIDGAAAVRKFDLAANAAGLQFTVGADSFFGPMYAEDIAVMPNNSDTVAISRRYSSVSPRHAGVAIYDNGVQRSNTAPVHTGSNRIEFSDSDSTLYGYNNETTEFGFRRMRVDSSGVSVLDSASSLISGFGVDILYDSGLIYSTNGVALDPVSDTRTGSFSVGYAKAVTSDRAAGRLYFLTNDQAHTSILAYDRATFVLAGGFAVPGATGIPRDLVHWGNSGFAFATSGDQVVITSAAFTSPANPNLDQLQVNHLVYDPGRNKIYASVPSLNGARGNTVSIIDPPTASIESSIFVGSEPNEMALSKDGSYLYVGLDGAGAVRKVDLATRTAGLQFGLGADSFFGPMYAADIAVMPGNPNTVAISRRYSGVSPQHAGVAIYDNGVQRPNTTPGHTGSNVIEFSDSPSNLYGYNNETTEFGFRRMNVDANGVSVIDTNSNLISGFGVNIAHDSGLIYATTGAIVDPVTDTLLGRFPDVNYSNGVLPDKPAGRVYFLSTASGGNAAIAAYDKSTFAQIGSIAVPGARGTGRDFVRWGTSGFAVATASQVLITSGLLPQPKPVEITTTALPPTMNGKRYDFTLASAGGVAPVRWALIAGSLPPGLSLSSQGRISGTVGNADATTYSFTVQVTDAATPAASATKNLSVLVKTGLGGNNYCATATPASFGRISASLSPYGDIDVYSFDGVAGASITIETFAQRLDLDGDPTTVDSQADTILELLDSSCSQLAINDDLSSTQLDSRIAGYALPYTGKYYVRVSDSRGDGRPDLLYDLSLSRE